MVCIMLFLCGVEHCQHTVTLDTSSGRPGEFLLQTADTRLTRPIFSFYFGPRQPRAVYQGVVQARVCVIPVTDHSQITHTIGSVPVKKIHSGSILARERLGTSILLASPFTRRRRRRRVCSYCCSTVFSCAPDEILSHSRTKLFIELTAALL